MPLAQVDWTRRWKICIHNLRDCLKAELFLREPVMIMRCQIFVRGPARYARQTLTPPRDAARGLGRWEPREARAVRQTRAAARTALRRASRHTEKRAVTAPCTADVTMANSLSMAHWRAVAPLPVGRLNLCVARDIFGYTITRGYIF